MRRILHLFFVLISSSLAIEFGTNGVVVDLIKDFARDRCTVAMAGNIDSNVRNYIMGLGKPTISLYSSQGRKLAPTKCPGLLVVATGISSNSEITAIERAAEGVPTDVGFLIFLKDGNVRLSLEDLVNTNQISLVTALSNGFLHLRTVCAPGISGSEVLKPGKGRGRDPCHNSGFGLKGRNQKVAIVTRGRPPYIYVRKSSGGAVSYSGVEVDIVRIAAKKLGFNIMFVPFGIWTATRGSIINGTIFMATGNFMVVYNRYKLYDFAMPHLTANIHLVSRRPRPLMPYFNLVKPFPGLIWTIYMAVVIGVCVLFFMLRAASDLIANGNWDFDACWEAAITGFGIFISQGGDSLLVVDKPARRSIHLLGTIWIIFSNFSVMFYKSNLNAYLLAVDFEPPIDNDQDLVELEQNLYMPKGGIHMTIYSSSTNEFKQSLVKQIKEDQDRLTFTFDRGLVPADVKNEVLRTGGAYFNGVLVAKAASPLTERLQGVDMGEFRFGKDPVITNYLGFPISRGKPWIWKEAISKIIEDLAAGGIIDHLSRSYIEPRYLLKAEKDQVPPKPFYNETFVAAYAALAAGIIFSFSTFTFEMSSCFSKAKG